MFLGCRCEQRLALAEVAGRADRAVEGERVLKRLVDFIAAALLDERLCRAQPSVCGIRERADLRVFGGGRGEVTVCERACRVDPRRLLLERRDCLTEGVRAVELDRRGGEIRQRCRHLLRAFGGEAVEQLVDGLEGGGSLTRGEAGPRVNR